MEKQFLISVVIPVYNTEKYVEEAIQSIIRQTIGFEENIQLVLVNDGSVDNSGVICTKYRELYPDNVTYINFEHNSGVSVARNEGMKFATGKYITFFDSDDLWSKDAFKRAIEFLETSTEDIDLVSVDIEFFDAYVNMHFLNQNLQESIVWDVNKDYFAIRSIGSTCIIKREIAEQYSFNVNQKCWEDTVFINQIIMRKQKYGMLSSDVKYYYRKRRDNTSAVQSYGKNKEYFFHELNALFQGIYKESMKQCKCFIPMAQYLIAYALECRFQEEITILDEEELKRYDSILFDIMQYIEDKYLMEVAVGDKAVRKVMLAFKHGVDIRSEWIQWRDLEAQNHSIYQRLSRTNMNYDILKKWFALQAQGKKISQYFYENDYKKIAIYGMSDLGQFMLAELQYSDIEVAYAVDRRAEKLSVDVSLLTMDDALTEVDVCVVTAAYYFNEIAAELQNKLECPIISIEDVLYSME